MGNGLTTDSNTATDNSPSGHRRSSSLTSEAFSQVVQHDLPSTHLNATEVRQKGASPIKPITSESVAQQTTITDEAISIQPSSEDDGNSPSLTKVADIGGHQYNQTPPSSVMEDTMLDFLKQLREERRAHQKNLEKRLIGILEEAHVNMNLKLDRMQENFQLNVLNIAGGSQKEMIEESEDNADIEMQTYSEMTYSDSVILTQAITESQTPDPKDNLPVLQNVVEVELDSTVADCSLVTDLKLEKIEYKNVVTKNNVNGINEIEMLINNHPTAFTSSELTIEVAQTQKDQLCEIDNNLVDLSGTSMDNCSKQLVNPTPNSGDSNTTILPYVLNQSLLNVKNNDGGRKPRKFNLTGRSQGRTSIFLRGFILGHKICMKFHHACAAIQKFTKGFFHLCTGPYTVHQISSQGDVGRAKLSVSGWTFFTRLFLHQWLTTLPSSILCRSISFQRFESRKEVEDDANSSFNLRNSHRFSLRRKFTSFDVFMVIVHQESLHGSRVIVNL